MNKNPLGLMIFTEEEKALFYYYYDIKLDTLSKLYSIRTNITINFT